MDLLGIYGESLANFASDTLCSDCSERSDGVPHPDESELATAEVVNGVEVGRRGDDEVDRCARHWEGSCVCHAYRRPRATLGFPVVNTVAYHIIDRRKKPSEGFNWGPEVTTVWPAVGKVHRPGSAGLLGDDKS